MTPFGMQIVLARDRKTRKGEMILLNDNNYLNQITEDKEEESFYHADIICDDVDDDQQKAHDKFEMV